MRTARILAIVLLLAAIPVALVYVFRLPLAGWAVRSAMASAGLEAPQARVTALTFDGARLQDVAAGPEGARAFSVAAIEADYHWRRLLSEKKIDALRAGPGEVRLNVDEAGGVSLPGVVAGGGSGEGGALPFDVLSLRDVALIIDGPAGRATGVINADYDIGKGGAADIALAADRFMWNAVALANAQAAATLTLSADGQALFGADFTGDMEIAGASARGVAVTLKGDAVSWRDIATGALDKLAGAARVEFSAPNIELGEAQTASLTSLSQVETVFGGQVHRAALNGALDTTFSDGEISVTIADGAGPLALTTPEGASLSLSAQGSAPLYARNGSRDSGSFSFALASDGVDANGAVDFERNEGAWRLAAPVEIAEFISPALSLDGSRIDIAATSDGQNIEADLAVKSGLRKAAIGRLTIDDAPFNGAFRINADMAAQRATIVSKSDCFAIDRGHGRIAEQDLDIRLAGVTLCNAEGPLVVYTWTGETACTISGELSAREGSLKLGQTYAKGRPPVVRFDAAYHPARNTTAIKADLISGAMVLNDALDLSSVIGRFDFTLDAEDMSASASVDRLRVAQHLADKQALRLFAPVSAAGKGTLKGDKSEFTYTLTTPEGYRLGAGIGVHNMKTARGETVITAENLTFTPAGLQPNRISPALKGIVDAAGGVMDGVVRFEWAPDSVRSSADFEFENISFGGPTRAVTRTKNLNGKVQLTDLLPLTTNGVQTITVAGVDLDALQLERGVMEFSLPGDDTFVLQRGEFPWFGGTIGVYDAKASFTGQAEIPLRAQNIDLKQVLDYVKVEGLSGEGVLSGSLPLVFEDGKARIVQGLLKSEGPGAVRYKGAASELAAQAGENADIAFDFLRDLRYTSLEVTVDGALDGALKFGMRFEGAGDVTIRNGVLKDVPVLYRINLAVENIDLLRKANLANAVKMQIQRELSGQKL